MSPIYVHKFVHDLHTPALVHNIRARATNTRSYALLKRAGRRGRP